MCHKEKHAVWRDWLVENMAHVLSEEVVAALKTAKTEDMFPGVFARAPQVNPLNFLSWSALSAPASQFAKDDVELRKYLNTWYGDWIELYKEVTKDVGQDNDC